MDQARRGASVFSHQSGVLRREDGALLFRCSKWDPSLSVRAGARGPNVGSRASKGEREPSRAASAKSTGDDAVARFAIGALGCIRAVRASTLHRRRSPLYDPFK
jgi:hypothetical protein